MKPEVADAWVKALKSGKYKQTHGRLKDDKGYCCLGVLCDISGQGGWKGDLYETVVGDVQRTLPPKSVRDWAGMKSISGYPAWDLDDRVKLQEIHDSFYPGHVDLPRLNDSEEFTFEQIADFIDKYRDSI